MILTDFIDNAHHGNVILDKKNKFAFFPHNKVAQTSITRHLLKDRVIVYKDDKKKFLNHLEQTIKNWKLYNLVTFTILRDPYSRVSSAFYYLQKIKKIDSNIEINFFIQNILQNNIHIDPHFEKQSKYTKSIRDMNFDYIINIENINSEWKTLSKSINSPAYLEKKNDTVIKKEILTNKSINIINKLYYDDFIQTGYKIRKN